MFDVSGADLTAIALQGLLNCMAYYHVRLHTTKEPRVEVKLDLAQEELDKRILEPYRNLRPIVLGGRTFGLEDLERVEVVETPHPSSEFSGYTELFARRGDANWFHSEAGAKDVSDQFVTTPNFGTIPQKTDAIELVCSRFHIIAMQLRERHGRDRSTLDVNDEYDVQDLMHALLRLFFEDVRTEEWTPSYAGSSARMDFFLPAEQVVVETKKTRLKLGAKEVGNELIEDIARYRAHPGCKRLICFVYDPDGRVTNPRGIESDLCHDDDGFEVRVIIGPKGY